MSSQMNKWKKSHSYTVCFLVSNYLLCYRLVWLGLHRFERKKVTNVNIVLSVVQYAKCPQPQADIDFKFPS